MKKLITLSIGLFFSGLNLIDRANAQSTTTTIDTTPKDPSICILSKDTRGIVYGKLLKVLNVNGVPDLVVVDRNYTNTASDFAFSLFTKRNIARPDYFSIWSYDEILFQTENLPHPMSVVMIDIENNKFQLEPFYDSIISHCNYGNESRGWTKRTYGYRLPEDAKEALINHSGESNVKITYRTQVGNQIYRTEFPIGHETIKAWKQIDKIYRRFAEKKNDETKTMQ